MDSPMFEKHIRLCYHYCSQQLTSNDPANIEVTLNFLAYLVVFKKSKPLFGKELHKVSKYPLALEDVEPVLLSFLSQNNTLTWLSLIVLPHLDQLSSASNLVDQIVDKILDKIDDLFKLYHAESLNNSDSLAACILYECLMSIMLLQPESQITAISVTKLVKLIE